MSNEIDNTEYITPKYLLEHGFVQYGAGTDDLPYESPLPINDDVAFIEKEFDRRMFAVILSRVNGDGEYLPNTYVQVDAGCGFVEIPNGWWGLPIEYFESIYYGIRGEKPKFTGQVAEDIPCEVIEPKKLNP